MQTIPCSLHFIRKWIVHLQLGLSFINESLVDLHHNIQRSLGKAHSFVLMTCHLPCRISDLNDHHCSLCWAGPFIVNAAVIFFSSFPHLCIMTGEFFPLEISHVISLIAIPDALVHDSAKLNSPIHLNSIDQIVTSNKSSVYPPLCTWEKDPTWKHPEWYKIDKWMRGQRLEFLRVWSEYLSKV